MIVVESTMMLFIKDIVKQEYDSVSVVLHK